MHEMPAAADRPTQALLDSFDELLGSVCDWLQLDRDSRTEILGTRAVMLRDAPILMELEEATGCVKVYVDVGQPEEANATIAYRYLLEQNLQQPAPFFLTAGLHAASGHVVLYGYSPMPDDAESRQDFFEFLETCALIHDALRSGSPAEFFTTAEA
jgi:hypothetical protein